MAAEIEPLDADLLRKRSVQLRAYLDQDPDDTDEDGDSAVVPRVFTQDELDAIEEHHEKIGVALDRIEADYSKLTVASAALEASQDALDALVVVETLQQDVDALEEGIEDGKGLGAREDDDDPDDDPDADLDDEEEE